jgi:hypothetical protein
MLAETILEEFGYQLFGYSFLCIVFNVNILRI